MITLTPAELELRDFLAEIAVAANAGEHKVHTVTDGQIAEALDPDNELTWKQGHPRYSRVVTALYHVNTYEHEHRRPLVGRLRRRSKSSVAGYANLAREDLGHLGTDDEIWQAEMKASAAYWSGPRAGAIVGPDAQFDAIMKRPRAGGHRLPSRHHRQRGHVPADSDTSLALRCTTTSSSPNPAASPSRRSLAEHGDHRSSVSSPRVTPRPERSSRQGSIGGQPPSAMHSDPFMLTCRICAGRSRLRVRACSARSAQARNTRVAAVRVMIHSAAGEGDSRADTVSRKPHGRGRAAQPARGGTTSQRVCSVASHVGLEFLDGPIRSLGGAGDRLLCSEIKRMLRKLLRSRRGAPRWYWQI